jgi:hypothetical protein
MSVYLLAPQEPYNTYTVGQGEGRSGRQFVAHVPVVLRSMLGQGPVVLICDAFELVRQFLEGHDPRRDLEARGAFVELLQSMVPVVDGALPLAEQRQRWQRASEFLRMQLHSVLAELPPLLDPFQYPQLQLHFHTVFNNSNPTNRPLPYGASPYYNNAQPSALDPRSRGAPMMMMMMGEGGANGSAALFGPGGGGGGHIDMPTAANATGGYASYSHEGASAPGPGMMWGHMGGKPHEDVMMAF